MNEKSDKMSSYSHNKARQLDARMRESSANDVRRHKRHNALIALLTTLIVCAALAIAICAQVMHSYDPRDGSRAGANAVTLEELTNNENSNHVTT